MELFIKQNKIYENNEKATTYAYCGISAVVGVRAAGGWEKELLKEINSTRGMKLLNWEP